MTLDRRQFSAAALAAGLAGRGMQARAQAIPPTAAPPQAAPDPSTALAPPPSSAAPAVPPPTRLRLGYIPVLGAAALLVFTRSQMATKAGLEISLIRLDAAASLVPPPLEGRYDALAVGVASLALAKAGGADVSVVAGLANAGSGLVALPSLAAPFDAAGYDPAKALAAFRAKNGRAARIGTAARGLVPAILLEHWLYKLHAVPPELATLVPMDLSALGPAIVAGTVEGAMLPEPASTILRAQNPKIIRIIAGSAMFPDAPGLVLGMSGAFARDHADAVRALVQGVAAATRHIRQDIAKSAAYVQEGLGLAEGDRLLVARALTSTNIAFVTDPRRIEPAARAMLSFETERGDFAAVPAADGLFDASFYPADGSDAR